jgi:hypothetical protein
VFFTRNPTKLSLHFYDFSIIFYAFYKNQQICFTIGDPVLRVGPWKELGIHNYAPGSHKTPWNKSNLAIGSSAKGAAWPAGSRRGRCRSRPGKRWGGTRAHLGARGRRSSSGRGAGDGARRWPVASCSGEVGARPSQCEPAWASQSTREGARDLTRLREQAGGENRLGGAWKTVARGATLGRQRRGVRCAPGKSVGEFMKNLPPSKRRV